MSAAFKLCMYGLLLVAAFFIRDTVLLFQAYISGTALIEHWKFWNHKCHLNEHHCVSVSEDFGAERAPEGPTHKCNPLNSSAERFLLVFQVVHVLYAFLHMGKEEYKWICVHTVCFRLVCLYIFTSSYSFSKRRKSKTRYELTLFQLVLQAVKTLIWKDTVFFCLKGRLCKQSPRDFVIEELTLPRSLVWFRLERLH